MTKLRYFLIASLLAMTAGGTALIGPSKALAHNPNNLISDAEFTDWRTLDADGVQSFLNTKAGTRLRTFREGGRTAAQIIATTARVYGVNPFVILATIQKEESLIESNTNFDYRIRWAMGYGICDGCDSNDPALQRYAGFTKQINSGTWQLKYNYGLAGGSSAYHIGNTMTIDGQAIHFDTRATAGLYRYTPHLHGNESFANAYNRYKSYRPPLTYNAQLLRQVPAVHVTVRPGQRILMLAVYRNTGTAIWRNAGATPMYLGNSSPQDRNSVFTGGQKFRWPMIQGAVGRNGLGTFRIYFTAPTQTGVYTEKFRPVMENVSWMGNEVTYIFNVTGDPVNTNSPTKGIITPIK